MKQLKGIIIGAGSRGAAYAHAMHEMGSECYDIVGVADPVANKREVIKELYSLNDSQCFTTWEDILEQPKCADFAVIATQDNMHLAPALKAIEQGYNLLLEKPIAPTPEECKLVYEAAKKKGVKVLVCHVLRYTPLFGTLKKILMSGEIGEVMSVEALESVGSRHMSHSYVRGRWRNSETSSPMLLAKSCHDMDLIQWLIGKKCEKVQSFGALTHFTKENKPEGSPERCIDGCPYGDECNYNTAKLYQGEDAFGGDWFRTTATNSAAPTEEDVENTLRTTSYGKCVYNCDNNVVDHQVVNLMFEGRVTASFTMTGFTKDGVGREMRIFGTKGMLEIFDDNKYICKTIFGERSKDYFGDRIQERIDVSRIEDKDGISITSGHGGGDGGIVYALYKELNDCYDGIAVATVEQSYINHLICFAAEESRLTDKVINISEYEKTI